MGHFHYVKGRPDLISTQRMFLYSFQISYKAKTGMLKPILSILFLDERH